jgi:hypothetical protein
MVAAYSDGDGTTGQSTTRIMASEYFSGALADMYSDSFFGSSLL